MVKSTIYGYVQSYSIMSYGSLPGRVVLARPMQHCKALQFLPKRVRRELLEGPAEKNGGRPARSRGACGALQHGI